MLIGLIGLIGSIGLIGLIVLIVLIVLMANPKEVLYTVANPARGVLNRENITKRGSLAADPPLDAAVIVRRKQFKKQHTHTHKHMTRTTKKAKRASGQRGHHVTHLHACLGATQVSVRLAPGTGFLQLSSTRRIGAASQVLRFRVRSQVSQSRCLSLSWGRLGTSISSFLHTAMNLRPPSVPVSTHTSASNAVASQSPAMPDARMSLCTQSFPPRSLRTAPSRFPNVIRVGTRPPLIRISAPAHQSLLVRNVVPMLSHPVMSRARLYEVIRWSGLLRCSPLGRSKTRWCTVRSLDGVFLAKGPRTASIQEGLDCLGLWDGLVT